MKPIVALDIDGTLGDYHGHFLRFAEGWIGRPMPPADEMNPGQPLNVHMGVSKATYRQCKLAYRQGGLKRSMPVYEGASELTRGVRKAGAEVYICTTRPYLRLDNIDPDTRHWLRRNKIQYDAVLWGEHKYRTLVKQSQPGQVMAAVDDLPELVGQAISCGIPNIYMRVQPYNLHYDHSNVNRFLHPTMLMYLLFDDIKQWKEVH